MGNMYTNGHEPWTYCTEGQFYKIKIWFRNYLGRISKGDHEFSGFESNKTEKGTVVCVGKFLILKHESTYYLVDYLFCRLNSNIPDHVYYIYAQHSMTKPEWNEE